MNAVDVNTSFAVTLVDEWARAGVERAVVSPGSRNTPLSLALAREPRIAVDVVLDERSAGFRALGIGLATGQPAVVCCTSGTAAANLHPAVIEAHHARVPMLVCTADRPPELRDWGAGQTIDQAHLYGRSVRWFHDPGPPEPDPAAPVRWRALACRAVASATGRPRGPVHLNLPLREPLVPTGAPLLASPGRADGAPWTRATPAVHTAAPADVERLAALVRAHPRGVLVAGWGAGVTPAVAARFAARAGWPVLADPLSQLRAGEHAVSTYEGLLRVDTFARAHRPDLAVRVGAPLTSKTALAWLDSGVPQVLVDPDAAWLDPQRAAAEHVDADADLLLAALADAVDDPLDDAPPRGAWLRSWLDAERLARAALDRALDDKDVAVEGRIARDVAAAVPEGGTLVVASSIPVRALEWCMAPRSGLRVLANRGANGIDGFVSTAVGIASAAEPARPVVALCGDLCFLHDVNGLLGVEPSLPLTFVVADNDGGGIFSYLPQQSLPEFERLFATPQRVDLVAVARSHGVAAERVDELPDLRAGAPGVRVLVVPVDRATAVERHRAMWDAVATALGA